VTIAKQLFNPPPPGIVWGHWANFFTVILWYGFSVLVIQYSLYLLAYHYLKQAKLSLRVPSLETNEAALFRKKDDWQYSMFAMENHTKPKSFSIRFHSMVIIFVCKESHRSISCRYHTTEVTPFIACFIDSGDSRSPVVEESILHFIFQQFEQAKNLKQLTKNLDARPRCQPKNHVQMTSRT
jgi:hypothetical protein